MFVASIANWMPSFFNRVYALPTDQAGVRTGVVMLVAYVAWERRVEYPLLDPGYFRIPRFGLGALTVTAAFLAMFGLFYLLTLYLQFVLGYSPLEAEIGRAHV